jgi:hypothetical protein
MISTEAEDLLASVRQSISRARGSGSALHFVGAPDEPGPRASDLEQLQAAYAEIRNKLAGFDSLPPSPPTLRGLLGLAIVRFANRLFWWPIAVSKRFAGATSEFARLQIEQQEQQRRLLIRIEKRLHAVETMLSRSAATPGRDGPRE